MSNTKRINTFTGKKTKLIFQYVEDVVTTGIEKERLICMLKNFMVTPCINNIQHFIFQLMHTKLKNVELSKHFKIRKLLQHVSVYKETIIREPQPVLS